MWVDLVLRSVGTEGFRENASEFATRTAAIAARRLGLCILEPPGPASERRNLEKLVSHDKKQEII